MGSNNISKIKFIDVFRAKKIVLFTLSDLVKIFDIRSSNTLKQLLKRLRGEKIIRRMIKNKYAFLYSQNKASDFQVSNFLVVPSYISLESALSFYGMLDQFPYKIFSLTLTKARKINIDSKVYVYSKIKKDYFKDFVKIDDFLIATKEKALFDYLYFVYKGFRSKNIGEELIGYFKKKEIKSYIFKNADNKFKSFIVKNVKL